MQTGFQVQPTEHLIPELDDQEIVQMLREIYDEQDDYRDIFGTWPTPAMIESVM